MDKLEMRSEKQMFNLINNIAINDERIRAVILNGSRANPDVKKDTYQDYDIVYIVDETEPFIDDIDWIKRFGEIGIIQEPNKEDIKKYYTWLMLFKDGNRIDLTIYRKENGVEELLADSLLVVLIDKDNMFSKVAPSDDRVYHVKKPSQEEYDNAVNNFWWCLQNVGKGIVRDQLPYSMWMYHVIVLKELSKVIDWYIGICTNFNKSVGMSGKYYKKYLKDDLYYKYKRIYSDYKDENFFKSIFEACDMMHMVSCDVSEFFGFSSHISEELFIREYLMNLKDDIF